MRVLYLHQYFTTPRMSGATRSYEMARRLVRAGHRVEMITARRDSERGGDWEHESIEGISVHWLPVPYSNRMGFAARLRSFLRFAQRAGRRAVELGGDVVFASSTPLTIAIPGVRAARKLGVPMVFEVRDLWPETPIAMGALNNPLTIVPARMLERYAYRNAERIVALSPGMADGVVEAGYPRERIAVIPNSSDVELFRVPRSQGERFLQAHPELAGGPLVIYGGTLGRVNGVGYLVEIASEMLSLDPGLRFAIAGDGVERDLVERRAREGGVLGRNLWMLPPLPKDQMPGLLSAATVTTSTVIDVPELGKNSANKFFDAFAAGRPIMINHEGWQAELLREHGAGIVVPPADAPEAARQLRDFARSPERLAAARRAATELADRRFDRDLLAAELIEQLERAVR